MNARVNFINKEEKILTLFDNEEAEATEEASRLQDPRQLFAGWNGLAVKMVLVLLGSDRSPQRDFIFVDVQSATGVVKNYFDVGIEDSLARRAVRQQGASLLGTEVGVFIRENKLNGGEKV